MFKITPGSADDHPTCPTTGRLAVTAGTMPPVLSPAAVTDVSARIVGNVSQVVRGQSTAVRLLAAAFLSGGHVLIEDTPGHGKTTLAHAFARSVAAHFRRVQGAPDLLPSDVTGSSVWNQLAQSFTFVPGPIFSHVLLVDELNRTPPRTQAAFLEAMEEGTVTVDGVSHPLPAPFTVIATQNPLEQHGVYPLPEGQLDRFALRITLAPLSELDELEVLRDQVHHATVTDLPPVIDIATWQASCSAVRSVYVAPAVSAYALALVRATRHHPQIAHGASSRAAISFVRTAQAWAVVSGREYVVPEDLQALARVTLEHRIVGAGAGAGAALDDIVARTPVPLGS